MAQRRVDNYAEARDTMHCLNPTVDAGNLNAAISVLNELGVKHQTNIHTQDASINWGVCATTNTGLQLTEVKNIGQNTMPDVRGYGLRDALFRLEKMGLRVKVHGVGRVTSQTMEPGHVFKRGEVVELYLGDAQREVADQKETKSKDDADVDEMVQHEMAPSTQPVAPAPRTDAPEGDTPAKPKQKAPAKAEATKPDDRKTARKADSKTSDNAKKKDTDRKAESAKKKDTPKKTASEKKPKADKSEKRKSKSGSSTANSSASTAKHAADKSKTSAKKHA